MSEQAFLISSASRLGVSLDAAAAKRLLQLLDELERWNRSFNLTAITQRAQMLTHHLLDSLSIASLLQGSASSTSVPVRASRLTFGNHSARASVHVARLER